MNVFACQLGLFEDERIEGKKVWQAVSLVFLGQPNTSLWSKKVCEFQNIKNGLWHFKDVCQTLTSNNYKLHPYEMYVLLKIPFHRNAEEDILIWQKHCGGVILSIQQRAIVKGS